MVLNRANEKILQIIIPILALADGVIHLSLDFVLFRGNLFGPLTAGGPPPGAAPRRTGPPPGPRGNPLILPLNQLFLLNFVGSVVLVLLFWYSRRWLGERRWLMNIALIAYAAATFTAWMIFGQPNPMGLGYLSKSIEIILIIALLVDTWSILRTRARRTSAQVAS